jgi:hypothetical protein
MGKEPYRDSTADVKGASRQRLAWRVFNYIVGALALAVLAFATWLPPEIGRGGTRVSERYWQAAAAGALLFALWVIAKRLSYSLCARYGKYGYQQ